MKNTFFRAMSYTLMLGVLLLGFSLFVSGQTGSNTNTQPQATAKEAPTMTATLVDPEKKAQQKSATVDVKVTGIKLIDPSQGQRAAQGG